MHLMSEIVRSKFQKLEPMLGKAFTFYPTNPVPAAAARILLSLLILTKSSMVRSILKPKIIRDLWYNEQTCCLYETCWIQVELKIFFCVWNIPKSSKT